MVFQPKQRRVNRKIERLGHIDQIANKMILAFAFVRVLKAFSSLRGQERPTCVFVKINGHD